MSDYISRADAIEAVCGKCSTETRMECALNGYFCCDRRELEALPSADAVEVDRTSEWVAVRREEYEDLIADAEQVTGKLKSVEISTDKGDESTMSQPNGKLDLISRADVLKYPIRLDHYDEVNGSREFVYGVESVIEYVESLPSADAVSREKYDKLIQELNDSPKGKWIPLDGKLPKIIGEHVLVTIKWADDDLEVCEMCPTVADRYNIIAFQQMPLPYDGEPLKSELQCSGARMKGGAE